jgi:hypothetical protein
MHYGLRTVLGGEIMVTRPARAASAVGVAGLLLLLAACGSAARAGPGSAATSPASTTAPTADPESSLGSGASAAPAALADACALITQRQASAAFGAQSSPPQPAAAGSVGGRACAYFANAGQDSLHVGLLRNASESQVAAIKASVQLPGASTSIASGIGDSATVMSTGPTAVVIFTKHSSLVILTLNMIGQPTPVHAAIVLAKDAAARL